MTFSKANRRINHWSTKRLAGELEANTYETITTNCENIMRQIKTKYLFDYRSPLDSRQVFQCVGVRIKKPSLSFDRVAVVEAKTWYELVVRQGLPPRWFSDNQDNVHVSLRRPSEDGSARYRTGSVVRAILRPDPYQWLVPAWTTYAMLPGLWHTRKPGRRAKFKGPHPDVLDLVKAHHMIIQHEKGHGYLGAANLDKYLVEPGRVNQERFFVMKSRVK